MKGLKRHKLS